MAEYVCRKDGYDLTDLVIAAIEDRGSDIADFSPVVEGLADEESWDGDAESFLTRKSRNSSDMVVVRVICPKDDTKNVFTVRRSN